MGQLLSIFPPLQYAGGADVIPKVRKRSIEENSNVPRKKPRIETIVVVDPEDEDTLEQFFGPQQRNFNEVHPLVAKSEEVTTELLPQSTTLRGASRPIPLNAESLTDEDLWLDNRLSLTQIENDRIYRTHFDLLCNCYFETPNQSWVIDFEFQPLANPMWAVPYELSIRTIRGDFVINTHIDYGMTREALINTIKPYLSRNGDPSEGQMKNVERRFNRHFSLGKTTGMTIPDIKAAIEALDYNDEVILLGWGNYGDIGLFHRIMNGHQGPVLPKWHFKPFPCHVSKIASRCLRSNGSQRLETVHKSICPCTSRRYHDADEDVLAMTEVIKVLVHMRHV